MHNISNENFCLAAYEQCIIYIPVSGMFVRLCNCDCLFLQLPEAFQIP
jgi:hypothetical protein